VDALCVQSKGSVAAYFKAVVKLTRRQHERERQE
jgi:hypothetical protein